MFRPQWPQSLHSLGLEFWLPLPLLGLVFWIGGGLVTDRMLSHSYRPKVHIQANMPLQGQPQKMVLAIKVEIYKQQGFSKVKVKTANSALKQMEFEFPVTEFSQVEAEISQELGLSAEHIRMVARYQINAR